MNYFKHILNFVTLKKDKTIKDQLKRMNEVEDYEKLNYPLVYYVRHNNLIEIKKLLKNGEDVNKRGKDLRNPLALAFALNNIECAKKLLKNGANPNLLCGQDSLSFLAPMSASNVEEQEKAWIYTKKV